MAQKIPNSVIGAASSVIAAHYFSHSKLNSLFLESGAPGEVPLGNCEAKCEAWLRRCNDDPTVDALAVLGRVIQNFMDMQGMEDQREIVEGRRRINDSLARSQLAYQINGYVSLAGASPAARSLADYLRAGDFASVDAEFDRAVAQLQRDPHAAITAACSIIEAMCKTCIETLGVEMPASQTVGPLWRAIQPRLGLSMDRTLADDQKRILQGLASIVDGVGAYRTHIGSAHGRGVDPPAIAISDARLAVNAAHTLVAFIMERWQAVVAQEATDRASQHPWQR